MFDPVLVMKVLQTLVLRLLKDFMLSFLCIEVECVAYLKEVQCVKNGLFLPSSFSYLSPSCFSVLSLVILNRLIRRILKMELEELA